MTNSKNIKHEIFDLIIIGGGLNGAGIALDAALRKLKVLLIDKDDFGSHTTSASTKLIHGGLRYLEYFEFGLVHESLMERERLLKNAPHLLWPIKINLPIYAHSKRGPLMIKAGMIFYDLFSLQKSLPHHHFYYRKNVLKKVEPSIKHEGLRAIATYYDCQVGYPERLCLEVVLSAKQEGAAVMNYAELINYRQQQDGLKELGIYDHNTQQSFAVKAKVVVNAAGIFVDNVNHLVEKKISQKIAGTKGSHIVIDKCAAGPQDALYVEAIQDGRPFFIVPWRDYYLVGTTDIYYDGDLNNIAASQQEIDYLLSELNYLLPEHKFTQADVLYSYSGVRPLPHEPGKKESQVTRRHIIFDHEKYDGNKNYFSIIGGKLTTYRQLAEDCVNLICDKLGRTEKCVTKNYQLTGAKGIEHLNYYVKDQIDESEKTYQLSSDTIRFLINFYGSNFKKVVALTKDNPVLKERICESQPDILAQVVYAIQTEQAKNLEDILIRRTSIGTSKCLGLDCVEKVAQVAAPFFGWRKREIGKKIQNYQITIEQRYVLH